SRLDCGKADVTKMFERAGIIGAQKPHPFLSRALNRANTIEQLYSEYLNCELYQLNKIESQFEQHESSSAMNEIPFAHQGRIRYKKRNAEYCKNLAGRYLQFESNGKMHRATIMLPDGMFAPYILDYLRHEYPEAEEFNASDVQEKVVLDGIVQEMSKDEQRLNNVSYLIDAYFYTIANDESQCFYDTFFDEHHDRRFSRTYDFFTLLKNQKSNPHNTKSGRIPQFLNTESIKNQLKDGGLKTRILNSAKSLIEEQERNRQWDKVKDLKENITTKFRNLKNDCEKNERAIRRHRIQDIVIFLMVKQLLKESFSSNDNATRKSNKFEESLKLGSLMNDREFSELTVPLKYKMSVNYQNSVSMEVEIAVDEVGIMNYPSLLSRINNETKDKTGRVNTLFGQIANAKAREEYPNEFTANGEKTKASGRAKPLQVTDTSIAYNKLCSELDDYDRLRSKIFCEIHKIEELIIGQNREDLTDPERDAFYVKNNKTKQEKDAKRNNFNSLVGIVLDAKETAANAERALLVKNLMVQIRNAFSHNHLDVDFLSFKKEAEDIASIINALSKTEATDTGKTIASRILAKLKALCCELSQEIKK
ncbi:MAG: hypothetical protein HUJ98_08310, partial [Bacteroidaceae bacterium]|nr:hypothetical protein [Bacteroidaceae bacterium]